MSAKKKKSRSKEQAGHKSLYVKGFGLEWSELDMFNVFRQFGEIGSIKIITGKKGKSRGFGYVSFLQAESAFKAREYLHLKYILPSGNILNVQENQRVEDGANSSVPNPQTMDNSKSNNSFLTDEEKPILCNHHSKQPKQIIGEKIKFITSDLTTANLAQQKQLIGESIYVNVHAKYPERAGKITGMLLELPINELLLLLESPEQLDDKIEEAKQVLELYQMRNSPSKEKQDRTSELKIASGSTLAPLLTHPSSIDSQCSQGPMNKESIWMIDKMNGEGRKFLTSYLSTATASPSQQKQLIGESIYVNVHAKYPERAGKITGMLLELPINELLLLLESPEQLDDKIEEAKQVVELYQMRNSPSKEKQDRISELKIASGSTLAPLLTHPSSTDSQCSQGPMNKEMIDKMNGEERRLIVNVQNKKIQNIDLKPDRSYNCNQFGGIRQKVNLVLGDECTENSSYTSSSFLTFKERSRTLDDTTSTTPGVCETENPVEGIRQKLDELQANTCDVTDQIYETARKLYANEANLIVKLIIEKCSVEQLQLLATSTVLMEHEVEKAHIKIMKLESPPPVRKSKV